MLIDAKRTEGTHILKKCLRLTQAGVEIVDLLNGEHGLIVHLSRKTTPIFVIRLRHTE
jgi:hypothetical protein